MKKVIMDIISIPIIIVLFIIICFYVIIQLAAEGIEAILGVSWQRQ